MKRIIIPILCLLAAAFSAGAQTQQKQVRPFVDLGVGYSYVNDNGYGEPEPGMGQSLSVGVDIRMNNDWSISPSVGGILMLGDAWHLLRGYDGCDYDIISMVDCSVLAKYHFDAGGCNYAFGFGPALYFNASDEHYYIDYDPYDPRAGLPKNKKADIGIRLAFDNELSQHWYLGLQANAGLRNMMIQYPECGIEGSKHLFTALVKFGYKF